MTDLGCNLLGVIALVTPSSQQHFLPEKESVLQPNTTQQGFSE